MEHLHGAILEFRKIAPGIKEHPSEMLQLFGEFTRINRKKFFKCLESSQGLTDRNVSMACSDDS